MAACAACSEEGARQEKEVVIVLIGNTWLSSARAAVATS